MEQENTQKAGSSSQDCKKKNQEGKWTTEEQAKFVLLYGQYKNDWALISKRIKSRTTAQVRSHAQKYDKKRESDQNKIGRKKKSLANPKSICGKTRKETEKIQAKMVQSFFMEKIYPHFLEHPQDTFIIFSMIEGSKLKRRDMGEEMKEKKNGKHWKILK